MPRRRLWITLSLLVVVLLTALALHFLEGQYESLKEPLKRAREAKGPLR